MTVDTKFPWIRIMAPGVIVLIFFILLLMIKFLWAWTIPELFPGAVEQGLIAAEISWLTTFKVSIFVLILKILGGGKRKTRHT